MKSTAGPLAPARGLFGFDARQPTPRKPPAETGGSGSLQTQDRGKLGSSLRQLVRQAALALVPRPQHVVDTRLPVDNLSAAEIDADLTSR